MAITRNGAGTSAGFNGVSTSGAITHAVGGTAQSNALMMAMIAYNTTSTTAQTVSSVTDSNGNTWQKYTSQSANSGWHTADLVGGVQKYFAVEIWYCKAATIGTSINVTVNFTGTIDSTVICLSAKYLGYDATNPFDLNASLPHSLVANAGTTALSISGITTTNAHGVGVVAYGAFGTNIASQNWTFNSVAQDDLQNLQHNGGEFVRGEFGVGQAVTSAYSNVTYSAPTSADNFFIIGAFLTSDATIVGPTGTWASTEATDTMNAHGYPGLFGQIGFLTATEAPDTFAGVGTVGAVGKWISTEATDTFSGFLKQPVRGTWASTEAKDTFAAVGLGRGENGIFVSTEAPDIFAASGRVPISGVFVTTENADHFSAIGVGVSQVRRRRRIIIT